jgi:hypothetical protein
MIAEQLALLRTYTIQLLIERIYISTRAILTIGNKTHTLYSTIAPSCNDHRMDMIHVYHKERNDERWSSFKKSGFIEMDRTNIRIARNIPSQMELLKGCCCSKVGSSPIIYTENRITRASIASILTLLVERSVRVRTFLFR